MTPEATAGLFSRLTLGWLNDLMATGYRRPLQMNDMYALTPEYETKVVHERLKSNWEKRRTEEGSRWPLLWALFDSFGRPFYFAGVLKFIGDTVAMMSPYFLQLLIRNMEANVRDNFLKPETQAYGYFYCFLIFLMQVINTMAVNHYFTTNYRTGLKARTALNAMVYGKTQRLSGLARQEFSTGQMVNLVSADSGRIEMAGLFLHYIWSGPFQTIVILWMLYRMIGFHVFVGLSMFVIFIPIQSRLTTWTSKYRKVLHIY